mmetsp:Transcript_72482/g.143693  ORF Transcript_72482/g.143693 Transcript_72482/m.143693 type:complete len:201 (+) Transcript_72482:2054-2656(+)
MQSWSFPPAAAVCCKPPLGTWKDCDPCVTGGSSDKKFRVEEMSLSAMSGAEGIEPSRFLASSSDTVLKNLNMKDAASVCLYAAMPPGACFSSGTSLVSSLSAESNVACPHGCPRNAASACLARFVVAAMPPNTARTCKTVHPLAVGSSCTRKQALTIEMSSSRRLACLYDLTNSYTPLGKSGAGTCTEQSTSSGFNSTTR